MDFQDKVVLITGASSGIGASAALQLARQSAKLSLVGRNESHLNKIGLYCEKIKGIKPLIIKADLTDDENVAIVIKQTVEHFGKIDVLVNNAGIMEFGGIKDSNMETYDKVMSINMRAVYHLTMLAVPHLIESKGCIVNVSSITSTKPNKMTVAYNLSKAALDHFTKCVALELAPDKVRVNSVNPGFVCTNLLRNTGLSDEQLELIAKNAIANTPLKKAVESGDVGNMIAFLASDNAKNITGSCYVIDGGGLLL